MSERRKRRRWTASEKVRIILAGMESGILGRDQPVGFEPAAFGCKGLAARIERPEAWTTDRRKIGQSTFVPVGFDLGCTGRALTQASS